MLIELYQVGGCVAGICEEDVASSKMVVVSLLEWSGLVNCIRV